MKYIILLFLLACTCPTQIIADSAPSVFRLELAKGSCTGFLIHHNSTPLIITAGHCVDSPDDHIIAISTRKFRYDLIPLHDNDIRDVAILAFKYRPPNLPPLTLNPQIPLPGDSLLVLGWPYYSRATKKISWEAGHLLQTYSARDHHRLLALDLGARRYSGGPLLDHNSQVLGLTSAILPLSDWYDPGHLQLRNISIFIPSYLIIQTLQDLDQTQEEQ